MAAEVKVEKIAEHLVFPEGPVWHPEGYLIFSDIYDRTIQQVKPEGGTITWFSQGIMTNGMIMSNDNKKVYACCHSDLCLIEIDAKTRKYKVLAKEYQGKPFNNVNDVAIDTQGNVYFTDPKWGGKPEDIQGIYLYNKEGKLSLATKVENQPNGLVVSPDQQWLYVDRSGAHDIWRYKHNPDGTLTEGKQWVKLESNAEPDGMTIDSKGNLYVAQAGNGKLCVLSPEGKVLHLIKVFDFLCTNCEFEPGHESVLYMTCAGKKELKQGVIYKITFPNK